MKRTLIKFSIILLLIAGLSPAARSDDPPPPPTPEIPNIPVPAGASSGGGGSGVAPGAARSKALDFDNDVIEGMNKNPLDSLTRLGKNDDKQQGHLYHRKPHFRREIRQTVQEMGYTQ